MSGEQSDGEDSLVGTEVVPVDDETAVEFRRSRWSDPGPDLMLKDISVVTGAVGHARSGTDTPTRAPKRGQTETAQV